MKNKSFILSMVGGLLFAAAPVHAGPENVTVAGDFKIDDRGFDAIPFTDTNANDADDQFQFAIVSDRTGGHRTPIFHRAMRRLNLLQPEFVVSVGDMIEGYTEDKTVLKKQWDNINAMIGELDMPYVYTPGNHDFSNNVMADIWRGKYGADYFHFIYKNTLFLVLNTEKSLLGTSRPQVNQEQLDYAHQVLADNPDVKWTLLFMHQPIWRFGPEANWAQLKSMLGARKFTAFAGHMHAYDYMTSNDGQEMITLGATGGVSLLRGKAYGEFDHVTWVTMKEDGPVIANVLLDGLMDKYITSPAFVEQFGKSKTFSVSPWFSDTLGKQSGSFDVTVTNPFEVPMTYRVEALAGKIIVGSELPAGTLAPGESMTKTIKVKKMTADEYAALSIRGIAQVPNGDIEVIDWTVDMKSSPVLRRTVTASDEAVTFDGKLNDWDDLRFAGPANGFEGDLAHPGAPTTVDADDMSFRFDTKFDGDNLYIAVEVKDDHVTQELRGLTNGQDTIVVMLDGRPVNLSAYNVRNMEEMKNKDWMLLIASPDGKGGSLALREAMPAGMDSKIAETDTGYTQEIRVPFSYLNAVSRGDWSALRFNVTVTDVDENTSQTVNWQPDWNQGLIGTGTFFRK